MKPKRDPALWSADLGGSLPPGAAALHAPRETISPRLSSFASRHFISLLGVCFDAIALLLAAIAGYLVYIGTDGSFEEFTSLLRSAAISGGVYIAMMLEGGYYQPQVLLSKRASRNVIVWRWLGAVLFLVLILFLFKRGAEVSRGSTTLFGVFALAALLQCNAWRSAALRKLIVRGVVAPTRLVVIGTEQEIARLPASQHLGTHGVRFIGPFLLPAGIQSCAEVAARAVAAARGEQAEAIILALPWSDKERIAELRAELRAVPVPVRLLPDSVASELQHYPQVELGFSPAYEVQRSPLTVLELASKRCLDLVLSACAGALLLPFVPVIALIIKLDSPGPVFFRQRRIGFDGQEFQILKFRTMTVQEDGAAIPQARRNDARITRIGRVLRASSIDELPQLINVWSGKMSLVGPRPHAVAHDDHYGRLVAEYARRHHVKPGITGWAQIHGLRGETAHLSQMEARVRHDLEYISSWSLLLDIWILMRTVYEVCRPRNAF
ncbi:undecaprenyl-phosphate glucose phosphotransferase [Aquabacter sp. CN5-332]|uniref:undecaprenyl-phosphate glucose phosphotransferase n=1 Tax=Aquabacter sp. CN5-332 TaxID=3156608 RepID=UPI0032B5D4CD